MISINDEPVKSLVETEQILKKLPKGSVKIVAMAPSTDVINDDNQTQNTASPNEENTSDKGIITVEVSCLSLMIIIIIIIY